MVDLFKEILPSLMSKKDEYVLNTPEAEKAYVPFVVNKALSFHVDCILYANEMNCLPSTDKKMHYDYMYHSIKRRKRPFVPWDKKTKVENLEVIMQYYGCSSSEAEYYLTLLTNDQIDFMKRKLNIGVKTITKK